jgi:diguanylate cyclase (GGDEF)-like protein
LAVAALVMLFIAMLGIGILTSKTVKQTHLMRDAESAAVRWSKLFDDSRDDIWAMFRERRASDYINATTWNARDIGGIIAYELYDSNGRLFYTSGLANWLPERGAGALLDSPVTRSHISSGIPTTRLHTNQTGSAPTRYASVVIPYHLANEHIGSLVVYVDQTEKEQSLSHSFGIIATATIVLLLTALGAAAYVVISTSRERWHAEARARYLADHDDLTGLPNRQTFNKRLHNALDRSAKSASLAILSIDINRFKEINEAFGHSTGDVVLKAVAERIHSNIAEGDFAARIGSNEFAVVLKSATTPKKVAAYVSRLRNALKDTYWADGEEITCTFSMGAALAPSDADKQETLSRCANMALNRAKADGPNGFKFFERSMDIAFQRRREREQDLRNAVKRGEFTVQFQPQVCAKTTKICGQEALLRWEHPKHGTISPAYFIPLAEETELIVEIGEWALRRACEEAAKWESPVNVAVNLSPVQFNGTLADVVGRILDETGLNPARLELEITESMLISDTDTVVAELNKLRKLGVAIAMDDFGTGYSSLSYISSFPFNKIKIDKAFIQAMTRDDALNAIVKCIIAMGHALGVTITAEGVETEEQADLLRSYGCHQIQGYLFGHPVSAEACAQRIAESPTAPSVKSGTAKSKVKAA